jgi:hypothetical protein
MSRTANNKLAFYLDKEGIKQITLSRRSGINMITINGLCTHRIEKCTSVTQVKIMRALNEIVSETSPKNPSEKYNREDIFLDYTDNSNKNPIM